MEVCTLLPHNCNEACGVGVIASHLKETPTPALSVFLWNHVGKTSESVHCTITGPCLRMRHRPSARWLPIRKITLSCNFVAVYSNFVQFILQLKLSLYTTVHLLLEEFKISFKSSLSTQSVCHTISRRIGVGVPQKTRTACLVVTSEAAAVTEYTSELYYLSEIHDRQCCAYHWPTTLKLLNVFFVFNVHYLVLLSVLNALAVSVRRRNVIVFLCVDREAVSSAECEHVTANCCHQFQLLSHRGLQLHHYTSHPSYLSFHN